MTMVTLHAATAPGQARLPGNRAIYELVSGAFLRVGQSLTKKTEAEKPLSFYDRYCIAPGSGHRR